MRVLFDFQSYAHGQNPNTHPTEKFIVLPLFRRFIKHFFRIAANLTDLTRKGMGISKCYKRCNDAFATLKNSICSAPILVCPDWQRPFRCHFDALQESIGGTLARLDAESQEHVIAYLLKPRCLAEVKETANDRELLAIAYFLEFFAVTSKVSHSKPLVIISY
eukprot:IDg9671t1